MALLCLCILQMTIVGSVVYVLCRATLAREPDLSARLAWLGMTVLAAIPILLVTNVPRPWSLTLDPEPTSNIAVVEQHPTNFAENAGQIDARPAFVFSIQDWLRVLATAPPAGSNPRSRLAEPLSWMLMVGISIWLVRLTIGTRELIRLTLTANTLDVTNYPALVKLRTSGEEARNIELVQHPNITSPCVSWLSSRKVFVPVGFSDWSDSEQISSVLHELMHQGRQDAVMRLLSEFCLGLAWFHPLSWALHRGLVEAQELATDVEAAQQTSSIEQYRKGLSMLALRMDSQSQTYVHFGVSVMTNKLVRRIKMLGKTYPRLTARTRWSIVAVMMTCCGLTLAWQVEADETVRVASRSKLKSTAAASFDRPAVQPWKKLGQQDGYYLFRPADSLVNGVWADLWGQPSIRGLGINAENMDALVGNMQVIVKPRSPMPTGESEHQFISTIGSSAFAVTTVEPEDWRKFADLLRPLAASMIASNAITAEAMSKDADVDRTELTEKWFSELSELQPSCELDMIPEESTKRTVARFEKLKNAYDLVQGGVFTAGTLVQHDDLTKVQKVMPPERDPLGVLELFQQVDAVSVGLDVVDEQSQLMKLVIMPRGDQPASELLSQIQRFVTTGSDKLRKAGVSDPSPKEFLDAMANGTLKVVKDREAECSCVQLTMHLPNEMLLKFLD